jgi:type IV secretory pathway VirJ component
MILATVKRRHATWALALALLAGLGVLVAQRWPRTVADEDLGMLRVYPSWLPQRGFIYLFSGGAGWTSADADVALGYARAGYRVAGIDSARLVATAWRNDACAYLPAILENYSRAEQRRLGMRSYSEPILLGRGLGASLVYMAQLQAPPLAFAAAVAVDPEPHLPLARPFCDHAAAVADAHGLTLAPERAGANVPLRIILDAAASADARDFVTAVAAAGGAAPLSQASVGGLRPLYDAALAAIAAERHADEIADLPLVEVQPAQANGDAVAILYSGDGGWRDLDQRLAGELADKGMPVVGVDVLRYFWHRKSPDAAARDLARVVRHYRAAWHRDRVLLIGFSFGANMLPFLYNRLPSELQATVRLIVLLSPERRTAFDVDPRDWFGAATTAGQVDIAPQVATLPAAAVLCIYGEEEAGDSLCTLPQSSALRLVRKPGGHHFDENYDQLADEILAAAR